MEMGDTGIEVGSVSTRDGNGLWKVVSSREAESGALPADRT